MISIEKRENCTIFQVTGKVTTKEILFHAVQYLSGRQTDCAIWNFSRASGIEMTTLEIKGMADSLKGALRDKRSRRVALVGSKAINIGIGKLFTAFARMAALPNQYKVFRNVDDAVDWLADCCMDAEKGAR